MSTTHVAGPSIGFAKADRFIQRCMCCGEALIKLIPSRTAAAVGPGGDDHAIPQWEVGHMVRVDGNYQADVGDFMTGDLPDDFCLALVEM